MPTASSSSRVGPPVGNISSNYDHLDNFSPPPPSSTQTHETQQDYRDAEPVSHGQHGAQVNHSINARSEDTDDEEDTRCCTCVIL